VYTRVLSCLKETYLWVTRSLFKTYLWVTRSLFKTYLWVTRSLFKPYLWATRSLFKTYLWVTRSLFKTYLWVTRSLFKPICESHVPCSKPICESHVPCSKEQTVFGISSYATDASNCYQLLILLVTILCNMVLMLLIINTPIPVAARSKAWVFGRSLAGIVGSNPAGGMDGCLLWMLCVVLSATSWSLVQSGPTQCVVSECDRESWIMSRPSPPGGCCAVVRNY